MIKSHKNFNLILLVCGIFIFSPIIKVEAFTLGFNPLSFLEKTGKLIVIRITDTINYLIMQKRYVFDNYTDPNVYISPDDTTSLDKIFPSGTNSVTPFDISDKLISVGTSTLPVINNISTLSTNKPQGSVSPIIPGIITESSSDNSKVEMEIFDINSVSQVLFYTNKERGELAIKPLSQSRILNIIAGLRADDLFANQYFEHTSPDGNSVSNLALKEGYEYFLIGENLALGNYASEQEIVNAWMGSPGHKANILNSKYTELGVAIKQGIFNGENTTIAVQVFAQPGTFCPKPNQEIKAIIDSASISIKQMQEKALIMYENLNSVSSSLGVDIPYYNQKTKEYNYFAKKINDAVLALKDMIDIYNMEVIMYNSCIRK